MVETVGNVNVGDVDWAKGRVGIKYALEELLECLSKLHGLGWGDGQCLRIDVVKGQIHDVAWTLIALRNDSKWAQSKILRSVTML